MKGPAPEVGTTPHWTRDATGPVMPPEFAQGKLQFARREDGQSDAAGGGRLDPHYDARVQSAARRYPPTAALWRGD
jgi:hypothetical protein